MYFFGKFYVSFIAVVFAVSISHTYWWIKRKWNGSLNRKCWEMELSSKYFSEYELWLPSILVLNFPSSSFSEICHASNYRRESCLFSSFCPSYSCITRTVSCLTEPWTLDSIAYDARPRRSISLFHGIGYGIIYKIVSLCVHYQITPSQEGRISITYLCQWTRNVYMTYFCMKHENFNIFENSVYWTINYCPQKSKKIQWRTMIFFEEC